MRVELHIERLVVDADRLPGTHARPAREREFREALTAELARLLRAPAAWAPRRVRSLTVPDTGPSSSGVPAARPAAHPATPAGGPGEAAAAGRAAARSLHAALAYGTPGARPAGPRREAP
ncbi:hypothetical protein [Streptomyces sp. NPDC089799]|uniref:hypothetical protein n=1 Tax=Streptomyces sp. NPDC089799 TaxID=3155066 RepID=UPI003441E57E